MTEKLELDFVLFDMIGTTVQDAKSGKSLILDSFKTAFNTRGVDVSFEEINHQRGKSKRIAIQTILKKYNHELDIQHLIYEDFMSQLILSIDNFIEMPRVSEVFQALKSKGLKLGIGSGLPLEFMLQLMEHLDWDTEEFDYINSSDELAAGRPDPVMIYDSIKKLALKNKSRIIKIGDTVVDVIEGKNAGVMTAMVLSGTQTRRNVIDHLPDFIWDNVTDLLHFI